MRTTTLITLALAFCLQLTPASPADQERALTKVLQNPGASRKEKADACRELARVGTKDSVPALAALLPSEEMNHMARYALEGIPDAAAKVALRKALTTTSGRPLVGVIGSVAALRDADATSDLTKLLNAGEPEAAEAAARALGSIGTAKASKALQEKYNSGPASLKAAVSEGLFRCADAARAEKDYKAAGKIYALLQTSNVPQIRAGAWKGSVSTAGKAGPGMVVKAIKGVDWPVFEAATQVLPLMADQQLIADAAALIPLLIPQKQVLLIQALAKRGDPGALPALYKAANGAEAAVRLAAIRALAEMGNADALPTLLELATNNDKAVADAAREAVGAMPGAQADAVVAGLLTSTEASKQLIGLELAGRRRMTSSLPQIEQLAGNADATVRQTAMRRLAELGTMANLDRTLALFLAAKDNTDLSVAEQAIAAISRRAAKPEESAAKIAPRIANATPAQQEALLNVLASIGGKTALSSVRQAANSPTKELRVAAIRTMGRWTTAEVGPDLAQLAEKSTDASEKVLSVRGLLAVAGQQEIGAADRLEMCLKAAKLVTRDEEKKLLIATVGNLSSAEAVLLLAPYLSEESVRGEAAASTVAVAERVLNGKPGKEASASLTGPLESAAKATSNADLAKRAEALAAKARSIQ